MKVPKVMNIRGKHEWVFGAWYYCQNRQLIGHDARSKAGQPVRRDTGIPSGPVVHSGPNNDESAIPPQE